MPDWLRIFPDADHRWAMGLRPGLAAEYFAPCDDAGTVLPERAELLASEPEKYSLLTVDGEAALAETIALARSLGTSIDIAAGAKPQDQLTALGRAWEPDVVWLGRSAGEAEPQAGLHRVVGGIVCFPSSWALADKLGLPMADVHEPVPGLNEALARQVDRFLDKLSPGDFWTRENWSLSRTPARNQHTSLQGPPHIWPRLDEATPLSEVWIRLEHQILLRLPESDAVLFGIRIESPPLTDLLEQPLAAGRFARILSTMNDDAARYKNFAALRPRMVAALTEAAGGRA